MTQRRSFRRLTLPLIVALVLSACGNNDPEALVSSAKSYLEKKDNKAAIIELKNALVADPNMAEARFLLGKSLLENGDPVGAEVELRKAADLKYDPNAVTPTLAQAMLGAGNAKKVIEELAATKLPGAPAQAELNTSLGIAYALQGDLEKSKSLVSQALQAKPDHDPALVAEARLKLVEKDVAGALALLDRAVTKNPGNFDAWTLKGDILNFQGQVDTALTAYQKALAGKADYPPAHTALAMAYIRQDKLEEAGKQIEAMKKALPNNLQTALVETIYNYQKKDFPKARDLVLNIQKNIPNDPRILLLAGAIHLQLNSFLQAESFLEKAHQLNPESAAPRKLLAELYLRSGLPAKAVDMIEPTLEEAKQDPRALALAGAAYLQTGDAQKAHQYFSLASTLAPDNKGIRINDAMSQLALGKQDAGFAALEQIAAGDKDATADMALIATAIRQKAYDKALKAIDALDKKQPNSPIVASLRGTTLLAKGDIQAARQLFEKALKIKPSYFPAAASLASLDIRDKKPEDAKRRFESLLKADPNSERALMAIAEIEARTGAAPAKVEETIGRAIKAAPKSIQPRMALIKLQLAAKQNKPALDTATKAVADMPDQPQLLDALARVQQASGDVNGALATFGKVLTLNPGAAQPLVRMAELQMAAKQPEAALQSLQKALEIKKDFLPAQRGLALIYLSQNRREDALAISRDIQKQRPNEAIGNLLEGDIQAAGKAWTEAATAFRAGLGKQPAPELAVRLHTALLKSNKQADADAFEKSWLKAHPKDAAFLLYAAQIAQQRNNHSQAAGYYRSVLADRPNDIVALNNLAWSLYQMNDPKALGYAEQANKLAPKQPETMDTLAMLLAKKGDLVRARDLLQQAIQIAPKAYSIQLNYAKVLLQSGKQTEARTQLEALEKLGDNFPGNAEVKKLLGNNFKR